jgi:predicted secreted protein
MALNGIVNGTEYLLYIDAQAVVFGTSVGFSVDVDTKDISARETHNWRKSLLSTRKWSMEFEGKLAYKLNNGSVPTGYTFNEIIDELYVNQDKKFIMIKALHNNTSTWGGFAYLTSASIDAPNEDNSTFNLTFDGVQTLVQA